MYVAGSTKQFGTLDLLTRAYTQINADIGQFLTGLAMYQGQLYGVNYGTPAALYTVGTNGSLTSIGSTGTAISGLAFDATGKLYADNYSNDRLGTLNLATGAYTNIGAIGVSSGNLGGVLAFSNGTLYDAVSQQLFSLNTLTGAGTVIGISNSLYEGMALFDAGNVLYGIGMDNKNLYSINTATAGLTNLGAITGTNLPGRFYAATAGTTSNNVPEPSSLALFAIGALVMGWGRKRSNAVV